MTKYVLLGKCFKCPCKSMTVELPEEDESIVYARRNAKKGQTVLQYLNEEGLAHGDYGCENVSCGHDAKDHVG